LSRSGVLHRLADAFRDFWNTDLFPLRTSHDIVSSNSKVVLYGLFFLIGFAVLTYAITVTGNNFKVIDEPSTTNKTTPSGNNTTSLSDTQKLQRLQQLEQVNGVYVAAISGSLALGGTLIAQLWGKGVNQ
jgi:hypothetical protein